MRLGRVHKVHLVGIGGTGMCGIAEVLIREGFRVTGSDLSSSATTQRLKILGCTIAVGHEAENVGDADVLVYSSAVPQQNPELVQARENGIPTIRRGEMLAELMRMKVGIAVAGAHGKTTTTTLIGCVLAKAGLDPTVVVGGRVLGVDGNTIPGRSENMVAEADESDGSFLLLSHAFAVVTNLDEEHLEHYGSYQKLEEAFVTFMNQVPFWGAVVACADDYRLRKILPQINRRVITYGFEKNADVRGSVVEKDARGITFDVSSVRASFRIKAPVSGMHNASNALAAVALGLELGATSSDIEEGLAGFTGIHRRLEKKADTGKLILFDDYGHHPTEIRSTIKALLDMGQGPLNVIFQPHRYTRTKSVWSAFAPSFAGVERVWITDIYSAGEDPISGISSQELVQDLQKNGIAAEYLPIMDAPTILKAANRGILLTLGAGSITAFAEVLADELA